MLPRSNPISDLTNLADDCLHVFVIGPGEGEAIAVSLPSRTGWALFDGCRSGDGAAGLVEVLDRWRKPDEPIHFYALTHPHTDHARGIVELVEKYGAFIGAVAVTPPWRTDSGGTAGITSRRIVAAQVRKGLDALERLCTGGVRSPKSDRIDLCFGANLPCPSTVSINVLSPRPGEPAANAEHNDLSAVVEIRHGDSTIVLGSDLPSTTRSGGGWAVLCNTHPGIASHTLLKIPHHGSSTAHHDALFPSHRGTRAWAATPFNSHDLPDMVRMHGLAWIVARGEPVHLTAPPVSKKIQLPLVHPASLRLSQIQERIAANPTGNWLLDSGAVDATPGPAIHAGDSLWCFRIDSSGQVDGRWRGDVAFEVSP